ncbi:MAG: hypothetical protein SF187_05675 [Deltaproteobacteria bacterium]|nr:hypothetical protein [Deltaproteobacteria bacterium]
MISHRARFSWLILSALVAACSGASSDADDKEEPEDPGTDNEAGQSGSAQPGGNGGERAPNNAGGFSGTGGSTAGASGAAGTAGATTGAAGSGPGQVIEGPGLGMPPTLAPNASNPIKNIPNAERVLPGWSTSHVEHLGWQPPNHLYVSAIQGAYPTKVAGSDSAFPYIHPFRVWQLTESNDKSIITEYFRFPTASEIEETAWCKWGKAANAFWCYSHQQKTNKFVLRIPSPGLSAGPFELKDLSNVTKWSVSSLHSRMLDSVELASGRVYWTHKAGTNPSISRIFTSEPNATAAQAFTEVLAGVTGMEDPLGLAASPDGKTLYFTVAGFATGKGSLWSAEIQSSGQLAAPKLLVADIVKPRRLACDEFGNLYVTSGSEVRVFASNGAEFGRIAIVNDPASKDAVEKAKGKITLLAVAFGGTTGSILYASLGTDLGFTTLKGASVSFGALFRVPVAARGADFAR